MPQIHTQAHEPGAYPHLLNRAEADGFVAEHFTEVCEALESVVDYGTHLLMRSLTTSEKRIQEVVLIPVLLGQALEHLDAVTVLLRHGCVEPVHLHLRALFEARLYCTWILREETEERANTFYVEYVRKRKAHTQRLMPGTVEAGEFAEDVGELGAKVRRQASKRAAEMQDEMDAIEEHLATPSLNRINQRFEEMTPRRGRSPGWLQVAPPTNGRRTLVSLAKELGAMGEYRIIYDPASERSHARSFEARVHMDGRHLRLKSLRDLTWFHLLSSLCITQALTLFGAIIDGYRPGERPQLMETYRTKWRKAMMQEIRVEYQYDLVKV